MGAEAHSARGALKGATLDRAAERRRDPEWVRQQLATACVLPVWRGHGWLDVARPSLARLPVTADIPRQSLILLGHDGEGAVFAWPVNDDQADALNRAHGHTRFVALREACTQLPRREAGLLAYARGLAHWAETARYCGRCGAPTEVRESGFLRVCTGPECGARQFPRLDPAIIVRVEHGERILLGREPHWPAAQYSVLAGFVEPGESLEGAVRREVGEETGLRLARVDYHSSQPWPFPASLMAGFVARAADAKARARDELADVQWLTRDELRNAVAGGRLRLSPPLSISHRLIDDWLDPAGGQLAACQAEARGGA